MADATTPIAAILARLVAEQQDRLRAAWPDAARGEPAALRRARIVSRRLRALVALARAAEADHRERRVARDLRRVGRALGRSRELAVARADLARAGRRHRWPAPRLAPIARWLDRQTEGAARERRRALRRVDRADLDRRLAAIGRHVAAAGDARWRARLAAAILRRAARVDRARRRCGPLYDPDRLHAVRVAVKKLRYLVEIAGPSTGVETAALVGVLKTQQRRYGRLHDRQVLIALAREAAARGRPASALDVARLVDALESDCRRAYGRAIASLPVIDAAVSDARRLAALVMGRRARPIRLGLRSDAVRRRAG